MCIRDSLSKIPDSSYLLVQGDICDSNLVDALFKEYQFESVVHFAAESHVDRSIDGPSSFIQTNIMGTFNLLEHARSHFSKTKNKDYFSTFVNWFSSLGNDKPSINQISGGQDFFSKLMNRISG